MTKNNLWWLSIADLDTTKSLGVVIVEEQSVASALRLVDGFIGHNRTNAIAFQINEEDYPREHWNKLIPPEEASNIGVGADNVHVETDLCPDCSYGPEEVN